MGGNTRTLAQGGFTKPTLASSPVYAGLALGGNASQYQVTQIQPQADSSCDNTPTWTGVLLKKYSNWDDQHSNGLQSQGVNRSFGDIEKVVIELKVNTLNTEIASQNELLSAYGNYVPNPTQLDRGNAAFAFIMSNNGDSGEGKTVIQAKQYIEVTPDEFDQWLIITLPVDDMDFIKYTGYNSALDNYVVNTSEVVNKVFFNPETRGSRDNPLTYGYVVRNFTSTPFDNGNPPAEIIKEMSVSIKKIEIVYKGNGTASSSTQASSSIQASSSSIANVSSSSSSVSTGNGNLIINDNFEGQANNAIPAGWKTFLQYQINPQGVSATSSTFALIDSSKAHSGSNSVRVKTGGSTIQPSFIFRDLPAGKNAFYSRFWMNIPVQLGGGIKGADGNHAHFMSYSTEMSGSNKQELRFGTIQNAILGAFLPQGIDAGTENIVPKTTIPANKWVCLEFAMVKNSTFDQVYAWVDGQPILEAVSPSNWARNPGQFFSATTNASKIDNHISFGWRSFGDNKGVENIWFDDIAVSTEGRIGCN